MSHSALVVTIVHMGVAVGPLVGPRIYNSVCVAPPRTPSAKKPFAEVGPADAAEDNCLRASTATRFRRVIMFVLMCVCVCVCVCVWRGLILGTRRRTKTFGSILGGTKNVLVFIQARSAARRNP
jgi:hypothetical protein